MTDKKFKYFLFKAIGIVLLLSGIFIYYETRSIVVGIITIVAVGLIIFGEFYKDNKPKENSDVDKEHYKTLISLYKYAGGIIVLLVGIATWIIGGNINEINQKATNEIGKFKDELKTIKSESVAAINESQTEADKQIDDIRNNLKLFLDLTKDVTSIQIETIREDARNLALSSARSRIEEVFKSTNLKREIDSLAIQNFGGKLDDIVKSKMEYLLPIIGLRDRLSVVITLGDDDRSALDQLDSISQSTNDMTLRKLADKSILGKGNEFEKVINEPLLSKFQLSFFNPDSIFTKTDSVRIKNQLIDSIYTNKNIWKVSYAFVILRKFLGIPLNNFDFDAVRNMEKK